MARNTVESELTEQALTERELRFVEWYSILGIGAEAAKRAGFPARSARQRAAELFARPAVQEAIAEMRRERAAAMETTLAEIERELRVEAMGPDAQGKVKVMALQALAKLKGFDTETRHTGEIIVRVLREGTP